MTYRIYYTILAIIKPIWDVIMADKYIVKLKKKEFATIHDILNRGKHTA
jgi:hypothetical protein